MDGWIKLHRSILNSTIFDNPNLLKFWLWCLCKAYHRKTIQRVGIQEIEVNKGQFIFGRFEAAIELKMNPNTVYKYLQLLQKEKMVTTKSNNKFSIITVVKYSEYQDEEVKKEQQNNNKITTKEQQNNTNKNDKNVKNDKKNIYGAYKNVLLTEKELNLLKKDYQNYETLISYLDEYIAMKGTKYKSHYLAIKKWVVEAVSKKTTSNKPTIKKQENKPEWFDKKIEAVEDVEKQKQLEEMLGKI